MLLFATLCAGSAPALAAEPALAPTEIREGLAGLEELAVCRSQVREQAAVVEKGAALVGTLRGQIDAMEKAYGYQEKALAAAERVAALQDKAVDRLERLAALERERADRAEAKLERSERRALWVGGGAAVVTTAIAVALKFLAQ